MSTDRPEETKLTVGVVTLHVPLVVAVKVRVVPIVWNVSFPWLATGPGVGVSLVVMLTENGIVIVADQDARVAPWLVKLTVYVPEFGVLSVTC